MQIITDHVVIRGNYHSLSLCIYGHLSPSPPPPPVHPIPSAIHSVIINPPLSSSPSSLLENLKAPLPEHQAQHEFVCPAVHQGEAAATLSSEQPSTATTGSTAALSHMYEQLRKGTININNRAGVTPASTESFGEVGATTPSNGRSALLETGAKPQPSLQHYDIHKTALFCHACSNSNDDTESSNNNSSNNRDNNYCKCSSETPFVRYLQFIPGAPVTKNQSTLRKRLKIQTELLPSVRGSSNSGSNESERQEGFALPSSVIWDWCTTVITSTAESTDLYRFIFIVVVVVVCCNWRLIVLLSFCNIGRISLKENRGSCLRKLIKHAHVLTHVLLLLLSPSSSSKHAVTNHTTTRNTSNSISKHAGDNEDNTSNSDTSRSATDATAATAPPTAAEDLVC